MSIPMQLSIPLALHLRCPVTFNFSTNERWKPGEKYEENRTIERFAFIEQHSQRPRATVLFAPILRSIFNHPDWSQLHAFFTKRYPNSEALLVCDQRTLTIPGGNSTDAGKSATVHFNTDPSSVGLPRDLVSQLATAGRTSTTGRTGGSLLGPDLRPCSIGPAISMAVGPGAYMDLVYGGESPGKYPKQSRVYGWEYKSDPLRSVADALATTQKGGRGRSWAEWAALCSVIAEWVYEHDATSVVMDVGVSHTFKYLPSDFPDGKPESRPAIAWDKIPREYLSTEAIEAADAIRDVFTQLCLEPAKFQGIEWDFLEMDVDVSVKDKFYSRFGRKEASHEDNLVALRREVRLTRWDGTEYDEVSPVALKPCPDTTHGAYWESWLLSIQGGDVVVVKTLFQALWATTLLTQLPLKIKFIERYDRFPRYRDTDAVYL